MKKLVKNHPILIFYLVAFSVSWAAWAPLFAAPRLTPAAVWILLAVVAASPAVAALTAARFDGRDGRASLLRSFLRHRVGALWYAAAVFVPAALLPAAKALTAPVTAGAPPTLPAGSARDVAAVFAVSLLANPWEELGWRGFALPRLRAACGQLAAPLAVGVLAGLWHLPLFYWPASPMSAYPYLPWLAACVCTSYVAAWLFDGSGGSLLIVWLFHLWLNTLSAWVGVDSFYAYAAAAAPLVAWICWRQSRERPKNEFGAAQSQEDALIS